MSDKLTTASVQEFLKDFLTYSETQILEEGKEKDDILEVAQARGYNLKDNPDLAGFKTIFTFANKANQNRARLPKEKLLKALPGMIGKPVDIDHNRDLVVGHYIDYRYKVAEDMVVAYGVFYKSNFGDEWATAQKLFKAGKLGTSYEIWCPKNKRKYLADGTYELTEMEIAGGGLMFKEKPAFEDAMVLVLARKHSEERCEELVMASVKKYDGEEIITSAATELSVAPQLPAKVVAPQVTPVVEVAPVVVEVKAVEKPVVAPVVPEVVKPEVKPEVPPVIVAPKITCANCTKDIEFAPGTLPQLENKCPHCKAIVDQNGVIKYPPQVIEFATSCPSCRSSNWLLLTSTEDAAHVKCQSCKKEYNLSFEKAKDTTQLDKTMFVYIGSASCPQCNQNIPFSTVSTSENKDLTCPACNLAFSVGINKSKNKQKISKIQEVADLQKASAEGGNKEMVEENIVPNVEPAIAPVAVEPVVAPVAEVVAEVVVPVTEVPVVAPAEVVAEVVVEPIVEAPVTEVVEAPAVVEAVIEAAAEVKPKKTDEEIEKMEMDLCKAVKKGQKNKDYFKKAMMKLREMKKSSKLNKASIDELEVAKTNVATLTLGNEELKAKIQLLETSAVKILERKNALGAYSKDLSEKDILDDDKFELAKVKKENAELKSKLETASAHVAVKPALVVGDELKARAQKINEIAFPKK